MCPPPDEDDEDEWAQGPPPEPETEPPPFVVVIDTSVIVQIKYDVPLANGQQWRIFTQMHRLVADGRLTFPSQVRKEVADEKYPDAPGVWCAAAATEVQYRDPDDATMVEVLPAVEDLVDEDAEPDPEPADPYVVAQAYRLQQDGCDVVVATEDRVDRPPLKMAMTTGCERLNLAHWDTGEFVTWVASTMEAVTS